MKYLHKPSLHSYCSYIPSLCIRLLTLHLFSSRGQAETRKTSKCVEEWSIEEMMQNHPLHVLEILFPSRVFRSERESFGLVAAMTEFADSFATAHSCSDNELGMQRLGRTHV